MHQIFTELKVYLIFNSKLWNSEPTKVDEHIKVKRNFRGAFYPNPHPTLPESTLAEFGKVAYPQP